MELYAVPLHLCHWQNYQSHRKYNFIFLLKSNFPKIQCIFCQCKHSCPPVQKLSPLFILPMSRINDIFARIPHSRFSRYHRCVSSIINMQNRKCSHYGHFPKIEPNVSFNHVLSNHFPNQSFFCQPLHVLPILHTFRTFFRNP